MSDNDESDEWESCSYNSSEGDSDEYSDDDRHNDPDYYYCSDCKTYHSNGNSNSKVSMVPLFSQNDLLFQHPIFSNDLAISTQGPNLRRFIKQSVYTYLEKQIEGNSTNDNGTVSSNNKESPKVILNIHQVDKELLEKTKIELSKYEIKEKQGDELVEEIIKFNFGETTGIDLAPIELNIDGKIYKTTRKTILKYDSLIKVMIENKESGGFDIETDSEGRIVFRSVPYPDYFKYILMYMRGDEKIESLEISYEITTKMKKNFKFITEDFNLANFLEFHEICNYFCVKDVLTLIEKKIENYRNVLDLESLSEKYRNIEQEKEDYVERVKENEKAIFNVEYQIKELIKQLRQLEEQKSKLNSNKLRLRREQDLILKLIDLKSSLKTENIKLVPVEEFDITFNIGGEEFFFKSTELLKYESSLLYKLTKKSLEKTKSIFLDRDPSLFSYIYKYIKNGSLPNTLANQKQIKLIEESKFYGIDDLTVKIDLFRYPVEQLSVEDREMRETESVLRRLFSYDRENPLIDDPYVNLISVFDNVTDFYPVHQPSADNLLFDFENSEGFSGDFPIIATGKREFDYNFKTITRDIFEELDWNGVFIAGGAIQRCCRTFASLYNKKIVQSVIRSGAQDVDIFLYGLSKSEAEDKIRHIYSLIKKERNVIVVRTKYTVTFCAPSIPAIQVVTRLYKSCAEILIGFDIDACCVGYDGNKVWCLPRFHRAFTHRYNLVDVERQSLTYESRLRKYALRGFRILVPGYKPQHVKKSGLLDSSKCWSAKDLSGLALLLYYQSFHLSKPFRHYSYKFNQDNISISSASTNSEEEESLSDYGDFFCHKIMSYPFPNMITSYNLFIQTNKSNFICAFNDVENIIDSKDIITSNHNIPVKIEWITEQPGRQLLGSFHPVSNNFYACAYDAHYRKKKDHLL